jgi:hypothetical protein
MPHFFSTPDFYKMGTERNAKFSKDIDDFVQSGPFMQYARYKQAKAAQKAEAERQAEEQRRYDQQANQDRWLNFIAGDRGAQQQTEGQQAPAQEMQQQGQQPTGWDYLKMGLSPALLGVKL